MKPNRHQIEDKCPSCHRKLMMEQDEDEIFRLLSLLAEMSLIEIAGALVSSEIRYTVHPLVRSYVLQQMHIDTREELHTRKNLFFANYLLKFSGEKYWDMPTFLAAGVPIYDG